MIVAILVFVMLVALVAVTSYINDKDEARYRKAICDNIRARHGNKD